jgi:hypothetical protein
MELVEVRGLGRSKEVLRVKLVTVIAQHCAFEDLLQCRLLVRILAMPVIAATCLLRLLFADGRLLIQCESSILCIPPVREPCFGRGRCYLAEIALLQHLELLL